ncbi:MAG TPA: anti-sigma factor [Actinobacteria bacterium]|nr:anti-sigma factor [Actinomycetota bacterium]
MNCTDWRAAILEGREVPGLEAHLARCVECRRLAGDLRTFSTYLADAALWEEPPPDLCDRIVCMLDDRSQPRLRRRSRSRLAAWVVGAAAAVALFAVWVLGDASEPDWQTTMVPTESTITGTATVAGWNTEVGTRVVLDATLLPSAPGDHTYELWFAGEDGVVSAGTFRAGGDVELTVGVARRDYPTILVTLEPLDGDPAPSDLVVLRSTDA